MTIALLSPPNSEKRKTAGKMTDQNTLSGLDIPPENGQYGTYPFAGVTESVTREAISEIEADHPATGARRAIKQLCISLAQSIDKGNNKGRSIANEASQLFVMMQQLAPPEAPENGPDYTDETKRLFDALAAPAQFESAPARSDAAPPLHAA